MSNTPNQKLRRQLRRAEKLLERVTAERDALDTQLRVQDAALRDQQRHHTALAGLVAHIVSAIRYVNPASALLPYAEQRHDITERITRVPIRPPLPERIELALGYFERNQMHVEDLVALRMHIEVNGHEYADLIKVRLDDPHGPASGTLHLKISRTMLNAMTYDRRRFCQHIGEELAAHLHAHLAKTL